MNRYRIFGGKRYVLERRFSYKHEAVRHAAAVRKRGGLARVVRYPGRGVQFLVYVRND